MTATWESDEHLIAHLRDGDELAYVSLVDMHTSSMLRIARRYVKDDSTAEEVVQETWLGVLQGVGRFASRSSLKAWIFAILVNRAITRGKRDARQIPFSSLAREELDSFEPSVPADRFEGPQGEWPRHWRDDVMPKAYSPDAVILGNEAREYIMQALETLPPAQRSVVELRDIAGVEVAEIAKLLELSDGNVRVLLHRGRSKIRGVLENYLVEMRE